MKMKVICAWCLKPLGQKECREPKLTDARFFVSHGICDECKRKVLAEIENTFAEQAKLN